MTAIKTIDQTPIGFTVFAGHSPSSGVSSQIINDMVNNHITHLRWQVKWSDVETSPGVYSSTVLAAIDQTVAACSAAGITLNFNLYQAPTFYELVPCPMTSKGGQLPTVQQFVTYCQMIATRYNGQNGYGYIPIYELFNEDFDLDGQCRDSSLLPQYLQAAYPAIKAISPNAVVGIGACRPIGNPTPPVNHAQQWLTAIYANGGAGFFDYANLHFYNGQYSPLQPGSTGGATGTPILSATTLMQFYQQAYQVVQQYKDDAEIWVTEVGWQTTTGGGRNAKNNVTPQQQDLFFKQAIQTLRNSRCVKKMYVFTIGNDDGMSVTQGMTNKGETETYLPAFYRLAQENVQHTQWITVDDSLWQTQQILYGILSGNSALIAQLTGIFDAVPQSQKYPYAVFEIATETVNPFLTFGQNEMQQSIRISIYTQDGGFSSAFAIGESIYNLLHKQTLGGFTGFSCEGILLKRQQTFREADGITRRLSQEYIVTLQEL